MHLVYSLYNTFDLVVAFVGSAACCPVLEAMMERNPRWDSRFFFSEWNQPLMDKLSRSSIRFRSADAEPT